MQTHHKPTLFNEGKLKERASEHKLQPFKLKQIWPTCDWADRNGWSSRHHKICLQNKGWEHYRSYPHVSLAKWKICQKQSTKTQSYYALYLLSSRMCNEVYFLCNRETRLQKRSYARRNHFTNSFCKFLYQKKILKKRRWK